AGTARRGLHHRLTERRRPAGCHGRRGTRCARAQDAVGSPCRRTVLRIFAIVASGISSFTPVAPYRLHATKSPAEFLKPNVTALPSDAHFPFWGVFLDRAQAMLPLIPDAVVYALAFLSYVTLFLSGCV